jgi:hypothetical protein
LDLATKRTGKTKRFWVFKSLRSSTREAGRSILSADTEGLRVHKDLGPFESSKSGQDRPQLVYCDSLTTALEKLYYVSPEEAEFDVD